MPQSQAAPTASKPAHFMADPTLSIAELTLSEVASTPAHLMATLKEDVYLIERRVSRASTFYLTRDGSDVKAAPLSTKTSTSQLVSPFSLKLGSFFNGSFTITHTVERQTRPSTCWVIHYHQF